MSIIELQKIIVSNTPYTDYNEIIYGRSSNQSYHEHDNVYPILEQCVTRYFDTDITASAATKQQLLQLIETLVTTYKNISHNPDSPDIIHTLLTKYNKTEHTHLKLVSTLLPYFPGTNKISAHLPYEIEPNHGNVYTVNYLYYMGIRPNPIPASILNVKLLEIFINHIHDVLGPITLAQNTIQNNTVCTGLQAQCNATGVTPNSRFRRSQSDEMSLEFSVSGTTTNQPTHMTDNLLALSIRTHNMNILHPTNISYHISKYLIYHIKQNKLGPLTHFLDPCPNPFILGLLTLPIRYVVTPENHVFNFILLINYLAKIYDLISTEPILFAYLITPFNTSTFQHSFHSILYSWDIVPFLINSQEHQHIKECRPESYFPGIYNRIELLDYFTEFINTKEPPKKKENTNTLQHLTD